MPTPLVPNMVLGRGVLGGDRRVVAPGARIQEVRRIVFVQSDLQAVVDGVVDLGVAFEEAHVLLHDVAIGGSTVGSPAGQIDPGSGPIALAARIQVTPDTEVEGERAEGRPDTAVDVDFSGSPVRERDALGGSADVELQVLVDVVARLEIGRDRRIVIGLGDAAEDVVAHDARCRRRYPRDRTAPAAAP